MRLSDRIAAFAVLLLILASAVCQGKPTADSVLEQVERRFAPITDYRVDIEVSIKSPQMHMPAARARVYFKRPNKTKIEPREGFVVLPKDALCGDPVARIKTGFHVAYAGVSNVNGEPTHVLRLVPKLGQGPGEMRLHVEQRRGLIVAGEGSVGPGKVKTRWTYALVDRKYWLPASMTVEMTGVVTPQAFDPRQLKMKPASTGSGSATVRFRNYRVNKGIADSVFEQSGGAKPRHR